MFRVKLFNHAETLRRKGFMPVNPARRSLPLLPRHRDRAHASHYFSANPDNMALF